MGLNQLDLLYFDAQAAARARLDSRSQFRVGEPSGMLVAIARVARLIQAAAAGIEGWARRPATAEYLPRIPVR